MATKDKLLYLIKIFEEKSDSEHCLNSNDLIDLLSEYNITAERKSIYADIETLRRFGYDIVSENTRKGWYLASRRFEEAELLLLADSVAASRFMTEKKSSELIDKISSLTSEYQSESIHRRITVKNRIKSMNESIYYNIDCIHNAISQKKNICFKYIDYIQKNTKVFRHGGQVYEVSPYRLICDNENYYLIAGYDKHPEPLSNFRVDKMFAVELSETPAKASKINLDSYIKNLFGMYSGDVELIVMEFSQNLISVVYDRFGKDIRLTSDTENGTFIISAEAAVSPVFFGWLAQFGSQVKILAPSSVAAKYKEHLNGILSRY